MIIAADKVLMNKKVEILPPLTSYSINNLVDLVINPLTR